MAENDKYLENKDDMESPERAGEKRTPGDSVGLSLGDSADAEPIERKASSSTPEQPFQSEGVAAKENKTTDGSDVTKKKSEKKSEKKDDTGAGKEHVQKRTKRASRKELLDLLHRKNEMLRKMEEKVDEVQNSFEMQEDRLLRMAAEFENYKKRTRREWELLQEKASAGLIEDILMVLDDFDRALEAAEDEEGHFTSGVRLIYNGFLDVLKRHGLKEIEAQGRPFDPQFHEAISEMESDDVEGGHVAHVVRKGYLLNDHLLRPSRVVVAKKRQV